MEKKKNARNAMGRCFKGSIMNCNHANIMCKVLLFLIIIFFLGGCRESLLNKEPLDDVVQQVTLSLKSAGPDFTIAIIPDPQYYTSSQNGGTPAMLTAQTDWIIANKTTENIAYVACVGDISDHGDTYTSEWTNATNAFYDLDAASIPYGMAVGNHDQSPNTGYPLSCATAKFNQYFGVSHFSGKSYYGGHYGSNNDSHYDLFTAGGINWIAIYIEYDSHGEDGANMNTWAYNLLGTYANRKAIIVSHMLIDATGDWGTTGSTYEQGHILYDRVKNRSNVVMMLGGHFAGESYREDIYMGQTTIRTYLADYQGWTNGGNGYMRLMKFSVTNNTVSVRTYSPYLNVWQTDANSQFTKPLFPAMYGQYKATCDFTGDGATDFGVFRPSNGNWYINGLNGGAGTLFGQSGDIPVPADYNGDGTADLAYFRPSNGNWYKMGETPVLYGQTGDIPVPGDYNGDGRASLALFRPSDRKWYIQGYAGFEYGVATDIPVPGDYNGDGVTDIAQFRPSTGFWYVYGVSAFAYGQSGDIPVPGDYNGDGKTDCSVFRPSTGDWYVLPNAPVHVGQAGDIPAPGDYDGNGTTDMAYYRGGTLYVIGGANVTLGTTDDKILNLPYAIRKVFFP